MINEIPKQQANEEFGFCKVMKDKKKSFEPSWQKTPYKYNSPELREHMKSGGNVGIISGYGNLRILDIDDKKLIEHFDKLLDTFAVSTANGNRHYYIISEYDKNHILKNKGGEFRAKNMMVLIPGCEVD